MVQADLPADDAASDLWASKYSPRNYCDLLSTEVSYKL